MKEYFGYLLKLDYQLLNFKNYTFDNLAEIIFPTNTINIP